MGLVFAVAVLLPHGALFAAGPLPVDLGESGHFTLLAYSTITYPGSGTVIGDVGGYPMSGSSILVPAVKVTGTVYARDAGYTLGANVIDAGLLNTAKLNLGTAYDYAANLSPGVGPSLNPGLPPGHIGGMNLAPGVYTFDTATDAIIDGANLTLTGGPNDVWVFQMGRALNVEAGVNRSVILAGGALAKNVFWQVGSSATLGTYSDFKGTIMAYASVILDVGSMLEGRALALNEQVVFNGSIANMPTEAPPPGVSNVTLTVISEHGTGTPLAGLPPAGVIYTNAYGTPLTNSITSPDLNGGTQYVCTGWSMIGNNPVSGVTNVMGMVHTNDAVLTWLWSTNYLLNASANPGGGVTGSSNGFYVAGSSTVVTAVPGLGYTFTGWEVNGTNQGAGEPLYLLMDAAKHIIATFSPAFIDVSSNLNWNVNWLFDPRLGYFLGTLTITNTSQKNLLAPIWFEVKSTEWHWLRYPTGIDTNTGMHYLDISTAVTNQLPGIGNGDGVLDTGESVTVTGIELMGRREPTNILVMAVWADPPGTLSIPVDTDGDGVSDVNEYIAGTSATDPGSVFRIRLGPDGRSVQWDSTPYRLYTVWVSTNLLHGFVAAPDTIVGSGVPTTYTVAPQALGVGTKGTVFYKVEVKVK